MRSQTVATTTENSALATQGPQFNDNRQRKGKPWWDHRRGLRHTKEMCWNIHGKPDDRRPSHPSQDKDNHRNLASTAKSQPIAEQNIFSKEQLKLL